MTDQTIQTRPDGSIDTAFYMRRGRQMRAEAAWDMFGPAAQDARSSRTRAAPSKWRFLGLR